MNLSSVAIINRKTESLDNKPKKIGTWLDVTHLGDTFGMDPENWAEVECKPV